MLGMILWRDIEPGKGRKAVILREMSILQMRVLCAEVLRTPRTPEALLRRRTAAAGKLLHRRGITRVILPQVFPLRQQLPLWGLEAVSTVPLRQALAADWVRLLLAQRGLSAASARVAVCADRLTGEAVRTVTELALRHRYVLLDAGYGGEELARRLRREYGVSLLVNRPAEEVGTAEMRVLFSPRGDCRGGGILRLYEETAPLPRLSLPPALEERLPAGADRGQLLAALREAGVIRTGQITVEG